MLWYYQDGRRIDTQSPHPNRPSAIATLLVFDTEMISAAIGCGIVRLRPIAHQKVGTRVKFREFFSGLVAMFRIAKNAIIILTVSAFSIANAASNNSADLLQYVPADTPYVFASTQPLPSALADKLEPTVDEILQAYQSVLRHVMTEQLTKMSSEEGGEEKTEQLTALMEEVLGLMSLDGIRGAGIERESAFVVYGNGLLPVLRLELADSNLFDAAVARIEDKAGKQLMLGEAKGTAYKYANADKINLIIATLDGQAVITAVPASYDEVQVALAIGVKPPRKNLKKSKDLRSIRKEYGFSEYLTGFISTERLAGIFAGKTTKQDDEFFAAIGDKPPEVSDVCAAEIMQMAGIAPRVVFGYSDVSSQQVASAMIIELREDIAEGLATIPVAVPGLGADSGGLMSLGFGLNPLAIRDFFESRLDAMEADPFECEKFADLQAGVAKGREVLNQPIPPVVYSFRGFVANIADIQGMDMATKTPPTSIDATILVAMENAEALLMMAAMFDPQIAALNLIPDGTPVKLEFSQLAEIADVAFAALSTNALAISLGEGAEANSANLLVADAADPTPFISMNMGSARYYSMMGEAMSQESSDDEQEKMPKAVRDAMRNVIMLSGSLYERMSVEVLFTERGIEIAGRMKLSD
jgi:hypothetical protein